MSPLKFVALSGTISVTENLYIYEADGKMMIVDCGVGFPDLEMPGVELVLPDFSYIIQNKEKLVGIIVSQGHEDHIGALPFLLKEVHVPVWAAPLVKGFIEDKFEEHNLRDITINIFNPDKDTFKVGPFTIHPFRVTHSVPDTAGFAIDTPQGRIFHVPEHKMDQHPVDGMEFDVERAKELASQEKPLFLASDCLGSNKPGFTKGETQVEGNMLAIIEKAPKSVFATAISSNIGRFQQLINIAQKLGKKVVYVGRSIQKKAEIAHELGILKYPENAVINLRDVVKYNSNQILYIIAGCYGQEGSSLYRLATDTHERVSIDQGDMVVFSADPAPPYTKESEDFVIDELLDKGADVHYYDLNEDLYSSGHGGQSDIIELFKIVNPKYFIPIGGAVRFMHSYKKLAVNFGAKENEVFMLKPGDNVIFENGQVIRGPRIPTKEVLVHGLGIGDIGKIVLGERSILGAEGVAIPVIKTNKNMNIQGDIKIISKGFIFEKIDKGMLVDAGKKLKNHLENKHIVKRNQMESESQKFLEKLFFTIIGRRPMVLPVVIEV